MNKCGTCKHWKNELPKQDNPETAPCEKLYLAMPEDGVMVDMSGIFEEVGWEGEEIYHSGRNFGCIHHESK
jgi:hypothetical protein